MLKILKNKIIISILSIVIVFVVIILCLSFLTYPSKVVLGGKVYAVSVADTEKLLENGLSGHTPLKSDEGMFFVFQKSGDYGFWMQDMLFPIDIIWFDQDYKIVDIKKSVSPDTYPQVFHSKNSAQYVLEISAGEADKLGLKIGDSLKFLKKSF